MKSTQGNDLFLNLYQDELSYLRESGKQFAQKYPQVAQNLALSDQGSSDPHVERLLESFAFMLARIRKDFDANFQEMGKLLLETLAPHFVSPTPCYSIAHFQVNPSKFNLSKGCFVERGSLLLTDSKEIPTCSFQTVYPLYLYPLKIKDVLVQRYSLNEEGFLEICLQSEKGDISGLNIDEILFYIKGDKTTSLLLYESLFKKPAQKIFARIQNESKEIFEAKIEVLGFEEDELALPQNQYMSSAPLLMKEFFSFYKKFLFFRIKGLGHFLSSLKDQQETLTLLIPLHVSPELERKDISQENLALNCTPIINLFPKTSDPFRLSGERGSYELIADQRKPELKIQSIGDVFRVENGQKEPERLHPYFSLQNSQDESSQSLFSWVSKRERSSVSQNETRVFLSFIQGDSCIDKMVDTTIYANVLCSNGHLPEKLGYNFKLIQEAPLPIDHITGIEPVTPYDETFEQNNCWGFVKHLSTSYLGSNTLNLSLKDLKYLLANFLSSSKEGQNQIKALQDVSLTPIVRRFGKEAWRGFIEGLEVSIKIDPSVSETPFLFLSVLRRYLGLQIYYNSFVELKWIKPNGEEVQWLPLNGNKSFL